MSHVRGQVQARHHVSEAEWAHHAASSINTAWSCSLTATHYDALNQPIDIVSQAASVADVTAQYSLVASGRRPDLCLQTSHEV